MRLRIAFLTTMAVVMTAVVVLSVGAQRGKGAPAKTIRVDLSKERTGRDSGKFLSVVGNWSIVEDGGKKVLGVDGRAWLRGQPANGLAQNARAIYGSRHEEFIDNVKAFAYFPYAVAKDIGDCQYTDVLAVIEFNPKEFTCREVTHDYQAIIDDARALLERCRRGGPDID